MKEVAKTSQAAPACARAGVITHDRIFAMDIKAVKHHTVDGYRKDRGDKTCLLGSWHATTKDGAARSNDNISSFFHLPQISEGSRLQRNAKLPTPPKRLCWQYPFFFTNQAVQCDRSLQSCAHSFWRLLAPAPTMVMQVRPLQSASLALYLLASYIIHVCNAGREEDDLASRPLLGKDVILADPAEVRQCRSKVPCALLACLNWLFAGFKLPFKAPNTTIADGHSWWTPRPRTGRRVSVASLCGVLLARLACPIWGPLQHGARKPLGMLHKM